MSNYLNERTHKFSAAEFRAIPRNSNGDIIDLFDAYSFITTDQRSELSDDDWSRVLDLDEEVGCLLADARTEFGHD